MKPEDDAPHTLELYVTKSRFGMESSHPIILRKKFSVGVLDEADASQQHISFTV